MSCHHSITTLLVVVHQFVCAVAMTCVKSSVLHVSPYTCMPIAVESSVAVDVPSVSDGVAADNVVLYCTLH